MIRLFPMKVPFKNYSDVDWFRQVKNTELTRSCFISRSWISRIFFIFSRNCRCKRKKIELMNAQRCVCVCVFTFIDMVFRDNTVQTAIMFSVTNSRYLKRNCELNELFFENGLDRVWGNWIKLFLKIRKFQYYSYFLT